MGQRMQDECNCALCKGNGSSTPSAAIFWLAQQAACTAALSDAAAEMQGSDVDAILQQIAVQPVVVRDTHHWLSAEQRAYQGSQQALSFAGPEGHQMH